MRDRLSADENLLLFEMQCNVHGWVLVVSEEACGAATGVG